MLRTILKVGLSSLLLAAFSDSRDSLTQLEREIWALEYHLPAGAPMPEPGQPGFPDVERPAVKGRAVLSVIPRGSSEAVAIKQLRTRGFVTEAMEAPPGYPPRRDIYGRKEWCARFTCCATQVYVNIENGRVVDAAAYDSEWGRYLRTPTVGNSLFGEANCDAHLPPLGDS